MTVTTEQFEAYVDALPENTLLPRGLMRHDPAAIEKLDLLTAGYYAMVPRSALSRGIHSLSVLLTMYEQFLGDRDEDELTKSNIRATIADLQDSLKST